MKVARLAWLKRGLAPALALALAVSACGRSTSSTSSNQCDRDADCNEGQHCESGSCVDGTSKAPPGASCDTHADCESGVCEGEGCGTDEGTCAEADRACTDDLASYCGCDGQTFTSSGSCPGQRYASRGACDGPGDIGASCDTHEDCEFGLCEGQGCGPGEGTCVELPNACNLDAVTYCGCDGENFVASSSCIGARFEHVGACVGEPLVPEGCDFLRETEPAPSCGSEAACEQARSEAEVRNYDLGLRESQRDNAGNDVAFSDEELDARLDCVVAWLEELGLEANALENLHTIFVDATYDEIAPVLQSAVIGTYWVDCADRDCTYCQQFDQEECNGDAFCSPFSGWPVDEATQCLQEETFMVCVGANDGFGEVGAYQRDPEGQCWFTNGYAYNLVDFTYDETCTESEPADTALPDCE